MADAPLVVAEQIERPQESPLIEAWYAGQRGLLRGDPALRAAAAAANLRRPKQQYRNSKRGTSSETKCDSSLGNPAPLSQQVVHCRCVRCSASELFYLCWRYAAVPVKTAERGGAVVVKEIKRIDALEPGLGN